MNDNGNQQHMTAYTAKSQERMSILGFASAGLFAIAKAY
jgi:hypothetical protein